MAPRARVQKRLYYKIGEACKALGIQPYVLRYWETEFPALSPSKSRSGQRVYNERELEVIRRIKELLYDEGYTIAGAKKKLEAELASGSLGENSVADASPLPGDLGSEPAGDPQPPIPLQASRAAGRPVPDAAAGSDARAAAHDPAPSAPAAARGPGLETAPAGPLSAPPSPQLDTGAALRIQRLRTGIQQALQEAREILALLDS